MFGIGYLSGFVRWLRCLKSPHTLHIPVVGFGTRWIGEDHGDFEGLTMPAFKSSANSRFAASYFSSDSCQTLA